MKKCRMKDWKGEPEGFKARSLEAEVPKLPPPPPKNSLLEIKVLAPSSGSSVRLAETFLGPGPPGAAESRQTPGGIPALVSHPASQT